MPSTHESRNHPTLALQGGRHLVVLDCIGSGRTGAVHEALVVDADGARSSAAVKLFEAHGPEDRARLESRLGPAAERAAAFSHPNAVKLIDFDLGAASPNPPFAMMELVDGTTIDVVLRRRRPGVGLPFELGMIVGTSVGAALAAAAAHGLLHGAVAPSEIHVTLAGAVKLGGFGCDAGRSTASSEVRAFDVHDGRVTTLAPEIAGGGPADARSDVFALGVVMHELLVAPRFGHVASRAQAMQLLQDGAVPEPIFAPQVLPAAVRRILRRATAARPEQRFAGAREMLAELESISRPLGVGSDPLAVRRAMRDALRATAGHTSASA
jgi:serine/threonine protein kinase